MCGIAGVVRCGVRRERISEDLDRMWEGIASRGPDGRGQLAEVGIGLLNARLAVIDPAGGGQPVWSEDRSIGCVFNGEIYNFQGLRVQLEQRGHRFSTCCDTEVLVHLYEERKEDLVEDLRGMYAFAIYDRKRKAVVLGRDRFGMKPLFVAKVDRGIAFASSISSLLSLGVSQDPDIAALTQYFRFLKVPEPATAYREVSSLLPGYMMEIDVVTGVAAIRPGAQIGGPTNFSGSNGDADSVARAKACFRRAIESHLVADVNVGAFLSGGIDSSLVVAEAQSIASNPLRTFSISFPGDARYDETSRAKEVAERVGTVHETIPARSPSADDLRLAIGAAQQPFAVASFLPMLRLCETAVREVKVVLTGDGGDEVGAGYPWYRWIRWAGASRSGPLRTMIGDSLLRGLERRMSDETAGGRALRRTVKFLRGVVLGGPRASDAWRYEVTNLEARRLLRPEHRSLVPTKELRSPTELAWRDGDGGAGSLRRADLEVLLRDEMLPKVDRAGMAFGLEGRVPLLDDDFVTAMLAIPVEEHLSDPRGK
ncbi:MAG: asparagine synthase (glutamine-hydrolyzing), partial [Chloroflexota bacterium]|nr:asparagine synthase (glutamine-hydrolyzing) [Chloroflexota bacterium]